MTGTEVYRYELSERRATAVQEYLIKVLSGQVARPVPTRFQHNDASVFAPFSPQRIPQHIVVPPNAEAK
jgi:flagellar motor protein MotB